MERKTILELKKELIDTNKVETREKSLDLLESNRKKQIKIMNEIVKRFTES